MRGVRCLGDRHHTCLVHSAMPEDAWIHTFLLSSCGVLTSPICHLLQCIEPYSMSGLLLGPSTYLTFAPTTTAAQGSFLHLIAEETDAQRNEMTSFSSPGSIVRIPTSFCLAPTFPPLWVCLFSGFLRFPETLGKEQNSFAFALSGDFQILCH